MMDRKGKLCTTRENHEDKHYKVDQQKKMVGKTDFVGHKQFMVDQNIGNKLLFLTCLDSVPRRGCVVSCNPYLDVHSSAIINPANRQQVFNILIDVLRKTTLGC